jgi:hypothetical protein
MALADIKLPLRSLIEIVLIVSIGSPAYFGDTNKENEASFVYRVTRFEL